MFHVAILGAFCLVAVQPALAGDQPPTNFLDGCICDVNKVEAMLKDVPWNVETETWQFNAAQRFRYNDSTKISAENNLTVANVKAGQVIKTQHLCAGSIF
ncbi:MAG: hypothetical protein HY730_07350 [Candidatus Tectomicrobia bacterium]|uniref:Uncharacterized protein n=1 Tax=Tectimicrobiota bacterium TaxID=2528274 RepID=A0A933LQI2_UNCTE|nr:hypothetical protein [Candidatus Tectomicrobia bacterium]